MAKFSTYTMLGTTLVLCLSGFVESDFDSDRNECANSLVGLATCLQYVQGQAKMPTPDCCSGLKQVVANSKKCLCVLVKDRNEPGLGFKFNATLALQLPSVCSVPLNVSECIDLLHLAPNSADAQVFKQFEKSLEAKTNTTAPTAAENGSSKVPGSNGSGAVDVKSGAADRVVKNWMMRDMVLGVGLWCLMISLGAFGA